MLLPVVFLQVAFGLHVFPCQEMKWIIGEFTDDGFNEMFKPTYALISFDVVNDYIHTFRVKKTQTNCTM